MGPGAPTLPGRAVVLGRMPPQEPGRCSLTSPLLALRPVPFCRVHTDVATKCSGNIAAGKSEVYKVEYKGAGNWYCTATAKGLTGTASTPYFSRANVKECAEVGNIFGASIMLK